MQTSYITVGDSQGWQLALRPRSDQRSKRLHDGWVRGGGSGLNV
eukprot:COSAG01_NODE_67510_length_266_cov_75.604790_1_plen_43_part_01